MTVGDQLCMPGIVIPGELLDDPTRYERMEMRSQLVDEQHLAAVEGIHQWTKQAEHAAGPCGFDLHREHTAVLVDIALPETVLDADLPFPAAVSAPLELLEDLRRDVPLYALQGSLHLRERVVLYAKVSYPQTLHYETPCVRIALSEVAGFGHQGIQVRIEEYEALGQCPANGVAGPVVESGCHRQICGSGGRDL